MICPKCGANTPDGLAFCQICGSQIDQQPQQTYYQEPQQSYQQPAYQQSYQQPAYQQPYGGPTVQTGQGSGIRALFDMINTSYTALILGIVSLVMVLCVGGGLIAWIIAIVAIVKACGVKTLSTASFSSTEKMEYEKTQKRKTTSKILAIITLVLPVLKVIFLLLFSSVIKDIIEEVMWNLM